MDLISLISIRELKATDLNFVIDSATKCLAQYNSTLFKGWSFLHIRHYLESIFLHALSCPQYSTFVACDAQDSDIILAYIIADASDNHIFFNYTKYSRRKLGLQKLFLLPLVIDETKPMTVNFQTAEALRYVRAGKCCIINKHAESLIKENLYLNKELSENLKLIKQCQALIDQPS